MAGKVKPIPDGYPAITPYLVVSNGADLVEFLQKAFGATVKHRMDFPDGSFWHADLEIGDSHVMLGAASEEWPATTSGIYFYVEDVDATYKRALGAGATSIMEPMNMFYGDRHGGGKTPRATAGGSPPTSRTSRPRRWNGAGRPRPRRARKRGTPSRAPGFEFSAVSA